MSKEEILKIQKCILKVNIHCDGCKQKVKKILQKIDGVFTTDIDADQGKVTATCNVEPAVLIKKLAKSGKHAELWGAPKPNNNNQNHQASQFKNMQIDNGKGGGGGGGGGSNNNKGQKGGNNQPKGGQQGQQQQQQFQQQLQQLQQLQQMKGLQDLKLPQFKDLKMPVQNPNQKAVKFNLPEEDDFTDDELEDEDYDDELDDDFDDPEIPLNKMKPATANGQRPSMMFNGMMNGHHPQLMTAQKGGNAVVNGKKGGGGSPVAVPIQVNGMGGGNNGKNGTGGKHGCGGEGNNHNQSGGKQNGGKNGGFPQQGKNGNNGGGANNKINHNGNGGAHGNNSGNGGKKFNGMSGGPHPVSNGFQNMNGHPAMSAGAKMGAMGNMNNMPIAQMSNMSMGQMGSIPAAVQGLPATAMNGGSSAGYYQGAGPGVMAGNPYHQQQQYLAAMMNQQRGMGNDRFQPMMYARPPPAVNYMPPYPYTPQQPAADPYTHYFSDENTTSSCSIM